MQSWIASTLAGIVLGLTFYGFVRLRMHLGPLIRDKYGNTARRIYWLLTILIMVMSANIALIALRTFLPGTGSHLMPEMWFILVAVTIAFALISRRVTGNKSDK